jgi:deoxycytidylate deaminase
LELHKKFFEQAAKVAERSLCLKAKCGAIIVVDNHIIASGYNAPPRNDISNRKCNLHFPVTNRKKPKSDCTCCVHAEWRAITNALRVYHGSFKGSTLYFTRVDDNGEIIYSGEPYCTVCSRLALDVGIETWALWHEDGIKLYDAKKDNDLSFEFHCSP